MQNVNFGFKVVTVTFKEEGFEGQFTKSSALTITGAKWLFNGFIRFSWKGCKGNLSHDYNVYSNI